MDSYSTAGGLNMLKLRKAERWFLRWRNPLGKQIKIRQKDNIYFGELYISLVLY
jgi:hypothetical protein